MKTTDLVQKLQLARRDLALEAAITKLDKYHLLILDDLTYVTKDQAETSVLFELISARYERRSMLITANQPFGEWGKIFPDQAMTLIRKCLLFGRQLLLATARQKWKYRAGTAWGCLTSPSWGHVRPRNPNAAPDRDCH